MSETRIQRVWEGTKDHFDTMAKGANLLLVAHGAGLAACASFFKSNGLTAPFTNFSLFVVLFGTGFMTAISSYGLIALVRMSVTAPDIGERPVRPTFARLSYRTAMWMLMYSMLSITAAAWGLIFKSVNLL